MTNLPSNTNYDASYDTGIGKVANAFKDIAKKLGPVAKRNSSDTTTTPLSRVNTALKNLGNISVNYGGNTKYEKFHPAVDIANKIGTPIPFYSGGRVAEVVTGKKQGDPGSGNYVVVVDNQGNRWRYSHLSNSYVKVGDIVQKGQVGMSMGNTGLSYSLSGGTGSHLDLRIKNAVGKYINPLDYIG